MVLYEIYRELNILVWIYFWSLNVYIYMYMVTTIRWILNFVAFTTTYVISVYHHWCCEFESRSGRGVQNYVIKFVSYLRQVSGFLPVSFTNKTDRHDITEILLKVALNTINQPISLNFNFMVLYYPQNPG
jgi:hypothetical protein